jgi:LPS export ABC transporter protein LptC
MSKLPLKYLPIAGIVILLVIVGYFFKMGFKGGESAVKNASPPEEQTTVKNFRVAEDNLDKKIRYILEADEGIYSEDNKQVSLKDFRLEIQPLDGNQDLKSMEITGEKGVYNEETKEVVGEGDIQGHSQSGYNIFTEYILYGKTDCIVRTDKPVRLTGPYFSVTGKGLIFDTQKDTIKIFPETHTSIEEGFFTL